jgi:thymidylate kinase
MLENGACSCDDRVAQLFARMEQEGVAICVWKSSDRWDEGIAGKTDFDLLVAEGQIRHACALMVKEGWIPSRAESWRRFEGLFDFCTFVDGRGLHMHLHEKIVSGEKMVKSLHPPLTSFYFSRRRQTPYPPFVEPELELTMFLLRTSLKLSWVDILGAVRRRSALAVYRNYQREYDLLRSQLDRVRLETLLDSKPLSILPKQVILDAADDINRLDWVARRMLRRAISPWRSVGVTGIWLTSLIRKLCKRWEGVGKTLPYRGISVAICGPDGSGKTTTTNAVIKVLGRHLRVRRYYMGGNMRQPGWLRGCVMKTLWWPYLILRKICKAFALKAATVYIENSYRQLNLLLMRQEKVQKLGQANINIERGEIVLFERYPLFTPFGDDMEPSVHHSHSARQWPDIMVFLDIDEETAGSRRYEDDQDILISKVEAFRAFRDAGHIASPRTLVLRGDAPISENVSKILKEVDSFLSTKAIGMQASGQLSC